ncbi:MAG TPA: DUF1800 domain-containing protein [Myxococcaceae bacterium]|nr:DUF1800 domain-containing protein [Myxococcaceae bacterium]
MSLSRRQVLLGGGSAVLVAGALAQRTRAATMLETPFAVPGSTEVDLIDHVLARCTFGAAPGDRERMRALGAGVDEAVDRWIDQQLAPGDEEPALRRSLARLEALGQPVGELYEWKPEVLLRELSSAALLRAVGSRWQLREVMVELWSDHLNIDASKGECAWLKAADDREVIRRHALGRFRDLIAASALSPAMLWYLDGRTNRRANASERPNENYARELLELHTLGADGGYTQTDVMEAARCLTGWTVRDRHRFRKGRVELDPALHDDGEKHVLGRRIPAGGGARDLEVLLDVTTSHPATARHVATKLCRRFISDQPPPGAVDMVAAAFRNSGGDIPTTLRALVATTAFRAPEARRGKLKRPFQLVASALRTTGARTDGGAPLLEALRSMGQSPYQYPTPEGAPDVALAWTGTLLWRWQLAMRLSEGKVPGTSVDVATLTARAGGLDGLAAHLLGRVPDRAERTALAASPRPLALLLASPGCQRC